MMLEMKTTDFLDKLSSKEPVPGGGGASAAAGALGAALGLMVTNLTTGKKKYAEVEQEIEGIKEELLHLRDKLVILTDKDAEGFEPLAKAYRLPKETQEEQDYKVQVMEKALLDASLVPIEIMETALQAMKHLKVLGEKGSRLALSDVGVGILFLQAALEGASLNVYINTNLMQNKEQAQALNKKSDSLIETGKELKEMVYAEVLHSIR